MSIIQNIDKIENEPLISCRDSMRRTIQRFDGYIDAIKTGDPEECNLARLFLKKMVAHVPNEVLDLMFTGLRGQHLAWLKEMEAEAERRGL